MGAVFALFAGFYYWFPIITTYEPNSVWSTVHFYLLFIGVNITFGPMHLLGLSGMPRRILNYPDVFLYYNSMASIGSIISFISIFCFMVSLYSKEKYIVTNLNSSSLDVAVHINKYHHLHSFNTIPVINS